jgi:hypothetical protein
VTFFKCPQINPNHLIVFLNSYRFLRWWALCSRNGNFPALCGCEGILGRKSTDDIVSFHFPFMFLSCSFHVALISFHVALISFHVPFMFLSLCIHVLSLSVAMYHIKHTGRRKVICSNRSGGYPPERALFCICRYRFCDRFAIVLEESAVAIFRVHAHVHV